jgi:two-component system sensor histidine kinase KdpD
MEGERRTEELRGMVLNGLAHNFRTPLTSIKAAASALCADTRLPEGPLKELVRVIDEEADRLDRLLAESLKFARIESHRVNPRMETCSLAEIFSRAFARIVSHLRGHELAVEIPEGLPPLQGDRFLLEQMLFEVLDNSWKYSKPGSPIDIEAVFQGGNVILTVLTLGDEISVNERELIFAKFYRGAVHRSQVEGTGVGLSVARAIAEAHCGNIRLDTEPGGNAFRITLPAGK